MKAMRRVAAAVLMMLFPGAAGLRAAEKRESVFYARAVRERAAANAQRYAWAAQIRAHAVAEAERWVRMGDEELWREMFGPAITRSHMVWSSGYCPACRRAVPMYDWQIDAWERPWKARCPHCNEQFPKNDFEKYYRSGMDERGVFDPKLADRKLLVNPEHPDPADPRRRFGVDDGEGYGEGERRWRFIGAYLLYGQWSQRIEAGVSRLATAYTMTGERRYAHKAAVLLDRIADLWPSFDYAAQGLVYERARYGGGVAGYVYYAITSAYNVMALVTAYDKIFDGVRDDEALVAFLRSKDGRKRSFAEIQKNIEDNILRHALEHPIQVRTNYPGTERTLGLIRTVLEWPANRAALRDELDPIVRRAVAVDGVSGEKGLASYGAIAPRMLAEILDDYARLDPGLLAEMLRRNPKLRETYRFHLDTWINREYYPNSGDAGSFGKKTPQYAGLTFSAPVYGFLGRMGRATGDPFYAQLAWNGNGQNAEGLPNDIFAADAAEYAGWVKQAVASRGAWPAVASVNKEEWRIAILRHRTAPGAAVWLDYDSIPEGPLKSHYHFDAMNLGLYAKGLELLPEFGYPAVQFGDWHTPQALWHKKTAAHNTVVVDGADQAGGAARATLWSAGGPVQVVRASSPEQIKGSEYERTVALVETGAEDFYTFDVFRVRGGKVHAKHTHTTFAAPRVFGFRPAPAAALYGAETLMRGFEGDLKPASGWGVDWKIEDRHGYVQPPRDLHLRYTDLTRDVEAYTAESWTVESATSTKEYWIPTVIARRRTEAGELSSTFVSVLEPYEGQPRVRRARRLDREGEVAVRVEVELNDGRRDVLVCGPESFTWERRDARGEVEFKGAASGR